MSEDRGSQAADSVEFLGPFESYDVVVHGRRVPYLEATMQPAGRVLLQLDRRMSVELDAQQLQHVIPFIANCIAVASGYTCHPEQSWGEPRQRHLMPQMRGVILPTVSDVGD